MPTTEARVPVWVDQAQAVMRDSRWPKWQADIASGDPARVEQGLASLFWWHRVQSILTDPKHAEVLADLLIDPRPLTDDGVAENVRALERRSAGAGWERDDDD